MAALVRVPNVGEKVTSDVPAKTENEVALLHITPLVVEGRAILRVENEGPSVSVAARLERVGNLDIDGLPYRMKWEGILRPPELNQHTLRAGETGSVILAETVLGETVLPMPGGIHRLVRRRDAGVLETEITIITAPKMASEFRRTYLLRIDGRAKVIMFREKPTDVDAEKS